MALVSVNLIDTFDEWRLKTNSIGSKSGDIDTLTTTDKTSLVAAVNELVTSQASANSSHLSSVAGDTTPELGGPLNIGTHNITGSGTSQTITLTGASSIITAARFSGIIELADDPQPELAANLNLSTFDITGTGNINITGSVTATSFSGAWSGNLNGDLGLNSNNITGTGNINITGSLTATSIAGTVVGTTQSASDNSTKLATTAYVDAQVATENSLVEMDDTTISSPTNGQQLVYNTAASKWLNSTPTSAGATEGFAVAVAIALG